MQKLVACLVLLVACDVGAAQDAAATSKTGSFELAFDQRSPLSEMKSLTKRLSITDAAADYDLSKEPCLVFVPQKYDPAKPMGLVVLLAYKPATELPYTVLPQFEEAYCAVVVPKNFGQPVWVRVGLALDVAHNMAQRYAIDPRRVYVFGSDLEFAAQRASLNYAEVFSGGFWLGYHIYRPVKTGQGTMWSPKLPKPDPKSLALAKTHPFVLASLQESEQWVRWPTAFKGDGFKFIKTMTITTKQYHYPDFATDWLPDVLKHLDETTAKLKLPATKPGAAATTKPKAP